MDKSPYAFQVLSLDAQHEILAETFLAQERDLFLYLKNVERYEAMAAVLPPGKFLDHVTQVLETEREAVARQEVIVTCTLAQAPAAEVLIAALARLRGTAAS